MRARSAFVLVCLFCSLLPAESLGAAPAAFTEYTFTMPVDALSSRIDERVAGQAVSAWHGTFWTPWQELHREDEQDPTLTESNLVMLPPGTTRVRFRQDIAEIDIHPIHVSSAPTQFAVAAVGDTPHRILSRTEWGADESLLVDGKETTKSDTIGDNGDVSTETGQAVSTRVKDCNEMYANYPSEFKASAPVTQNAQGEKLRWPQTYSPSVRLLVVHHTAIAVGGDERPGVERMRALYQYHSQNRGWGDIGYHYVIDDQGQIYEGKAGGDSVVGGHVYCNNVGTIGVALLGNFDLEQPTQDQTKSLQWLLQLLAQKYGINPSRNVVFHGKTLPAIVGHRQLISTDCPGTAMWNALDQVRQHVREGTVDTPVVFPEFLKTPVPDTGSGGEVTNSTIVTDKDGLATLGQTVIEGRPGAEVILSVYFRATKKQYVRNTRIARLTRSRGLEIWQEIDGKFVPVRGDLKIPVPLVKKGQSIVLKVKARLPMERGSAALKIGSLNYTFEMSGKTTRTRQLINTGNGSAGMLRENPGTTQQSRVTISSSSSSSSSGAGAAVTMIPESSLKTIRILLTPEIPLGSVSIASSGTRGLLVTTDGSPEQSGSLGLTMNGDLCETWIGRNPVRRSVIRIEAQDGITKIEGYFRSPRQLRGIIECRVVDHQLTLINELPLEDYLAGLAEEPDTELYEKQRAFAIAARTYATYYLDPQNRKFPGKPYDGSDSPATFQSYQGYDFELKNPQWVRAARQTAGSVLTYKGDVIRPPYFSTDDGKTRTPADAGWKNFPAAEIYTAKDDPWCAGMTLRGHGVGMSGCGAKGQAKEGRTAEQILQYYYPGTSIEKR